MKILQIHPDSILDRQDDGLRTIGIEHHKGRRRLNLQGRCYIYFLADKKKRLLNTNNFSIDDHVMLDRYFEDRFLGIL